MANMSGQSLGDGNLKKHGQRAFHNNAGHDLRTMSQKRVNKLAIDSPFPPKEGVQSIPSGHYSR